MIVCQFVQFQTSSYIHNTYNLVMLTEEAAQTLGYKKPFYHSIKTPAFVQQSLLWHKQKHPTPIPHSIITKKHIYSYSKIGKTFGMSTTRYIEYYNGVLLYFQQENDKEYKGYCEAENLYMYYLQIGQQFLLHLTNGNTCSQFYFQDNGFYAAVEDRLKKDVIQLNFYEKYNLIELVGKGTYSKVYSAKNKGNGVKYAVKIVGKKDKNGSTTKNIVDQEKKIFRILNSDRVCKMQEFFEDNESFIFVLQFLQGKDLMTIYREKTQISLPTLVLIFKGVLEGLAYIHSKNIMHRDLKPQNIMIDDLTLAPKIIDFGLSLIFGPKTDKKKFKRCGTMGYMAHQVIHNASDKKKAYDCKCDLFSFGIIAHMMLLGYNPIKGKNYNETVQKNQECNIQLEKNYIIEKYGYSCYNFLFGLLQKDPAKRYSAQQALQSDFIKQDFVKNSIKKQQVHYQTQQKEEQAQFGSQDEQVSIPKFQNFIPNKINLQNRA